MDQNGEQTTLFSQEGFLASHTAQQESDLVEKMIDTSGQKCLELLEKSNQHGSWAKTFSVLLIGMTGWYSTKCKLIWKLKGTKCKRLYFQLQASTLRTEEIGYGLLPTPVASDATTGAIIGKNDTFRMTKGLPRKVNQNGKDGSVGLARLLKLLPTPTTRDYKGARTTEALENAGRSGKNSLPDFYAQSGKTSQLNPRFVAEMMGFPPNWTELPFQNGETKA